MLGGVRIFRVRFAVISRDRFRFRLSRSFRCLGVVRRSCFLRRFRGTGRGFRCGSALGLFCLLGSGVLGLELRVLLAQPHAQALLAQCCRFFLGHRSRRDCLLQLPAVEQAQHRDDHGQHNEHDENVEQRAMVRLRDGKLQVAVHGLEDEVAAVAAAGRTRPSAILVGVDRVVRAGIRCVDTQGDGVVRVVLDENGDEIELKDDEDDYIPGMRDEMSYKSDDDEITGSGFTIEDVPVEEDNSLGAFGDAGDDDDYTDDSDKEEE